MSKNKIKTLTYNALLAAIYATLTITLHPISYGVISFRVSEILVLLAFYQKKYIIGLIIGCLISNLASPLGLPDIIFGTFSSAIVCYLLSKSKNIWFSPIYAAIPTGLIIGFMLWSVLKLPLIESIIYVSLGEALIVFIGVLIFKGAMKYEGFKNLVFMK
jgi:Predicted membrane protein